jgi:Ca2+/H+ antiporter, TMEM165/GDT1 family
MDWKVALSSFGLIFVAEMGDKTQLAAIGLVARTKSPGAVFVGTSLALCAVSLLAVLAGALVTRYVPPVQLRRIAAVVFLVIGAWMLWQERRA